MQQMLPDDLAAQGQLRFLIQAMALRHLSTTAAGEAQADASAHLCTHSYAAAAAPAVAVQAAGGCGQERQQQCAHPTQQLVLHTCMHAETALLTATLMASVSV
jgi:hypothetical protein